jgi:hypothetical protein
MREPWQKSILLLHRVTREVTNLFFHASPMALVLQIANDQLSHGGFLVKG